MYIKGRQLVATNEPSAAQGSACTVVAMYGDLRGFSSWSLGKSPNHVAHVMQEQYEGVLQIVNDCHPDFFKFLGDGFLLVWDTDEEMTVPNCLRHSIDAAYKLNNTFAHAKAKAGDELPDGYGVGISVGEATRVQPQTIIKEFNEVDFLGYPLNCGARMQSLTAPFGVALCASTVATIGVDPPAFLYPDEPAFKRELVVPSRRALRKADELGGLRPEDRTEFRYLVWPAHNGRWGSDGYL